MADQISEIEKKLLVDRYLVSGQTKRDFAREHQIAASTMASYIKRYAPEDVKKRYSEAERKKLVDDFFEGEETCAKYSEKIKITASVFGLWLKKYDPTGERREAWKLRLIKLRKPTERSAEEIAYREKLLTEYLESDLTLKEFSSLKKIAYGTLKRWFKQHDLGAVRRQAKIDRMGYNKGRSKAEKIALAKEYQASGLSAIEFGASIGKNRNYIYKCLALLDS